MAISALQYKCDKLTCIKQHDRIIYKADIKFLRSVGVYTLHGYNTSEVNTAHRKVQKYGGHFVNTNM